MKQLKIKPLMLTVSMVLGVSAYSAYAKDFNTETDSIKGYMPYNASVGIKIKGVAAGATKVVEVGDVIYIPKDVTPKLNEFFDGDGDLDNSQSTLQWFILEPGAKVIPSNAQPIGSSYIKTVNGVRELTVPPEAYGKQIGFRIKPTTLTGDPIDGAAINVTNIVYLGGQLPPGITDPNDPCVKAGNCPGVPGGPNPGEGGPGEGGVNPPVINPDLPGNGNGDGDTNPGVDPGPDPQNPGVVGGEPGLSVKIFNTADNTELTGHATVNTTYRVQIAQYDEAAKAFVPVQSYDPNLIKWKLNGVTFNNGTTKAGKVRVSADGIFFTTQDINANALMPHPTNLSEQGLKLSVSVSDGQP